MLRLLNVPEAGALDPVLVRQISTYGFHGIRTDINTGHTAADHAARRAQIVSLTRAPKFFALFLLGGGHIDLTYGELVAKTRDFCIKLRDLRIPERGHYALHIGNEPDLAVKRWKQHPTEMARCFRDCFDVARETIPDITILCPSISNLDRDSIFYLEKMVSTREFPRDCAIAFHRYPAGARFEDAHCGYSSRFEEVEALKELADGRPLWDTETGWAELNPDYELTEQEVADRIERELEFGQSIGLRAFAIYQINSAVVQPSDSNHDRRLKTYGLRRPDFSWKPAADRVRSFAVRNP